eukprot:Gregarina_sp_Poly_1__6804@NODE_367_length_9168_cov_132_626415_g303_i0_p6_GENE_NODE_367_length_9168_cov_132_626415_g303_i0NODE_367_length_9168_cov_132_626415_g303_i0_p6_ORF_typecomplete_len164_score22_04DUF866/PF05907_13/3_2e30TIP49/PF06068_13/0_15_NODE_367_length_9168_cov_132_626415_g303_i047005191
MVLLHLYLTASNAENVKCIEIPESFTFCFDVKQSGGEEIRQQVTLNKLSEVDIPNSRGKCHLAVKFPGAKQVSTIKIEPQKNVTKSVVDFSRDGVSKMVPVCSMDCRGMEPIKFWPGPGFTVVAESGRVFENVDLSDPDGWCDYDPTGAVPMCISGLQHKIGV